MKTELSNYCNEYSQVLQPLDQSLGRTIEQIDRELEGDILKITMAGLGDVRHRLRTLVEKVAGQQAFLLIFGPLKSGKSTLMNALSGTYVSEVTSLPAYPCLVFVSYGEKQNFTVTRYNGRKNSFMENSVLQALISEAHTDLADRIRQVEREGGVFDPGVHYPEAIRRIDIELPAENLKESGTVLVDTPGLYSRMRFGYDLMTREFRNSAACAVFVVKTDNLFLEQVFAEFNELLDLFSRIFLVVNIDTSKRDLQPDGSLRPSLESHDPNKVLDAFETLAMSAPLRKASEEGRLKIYPIDLLNAASSFLKGEEETPFTAKKAAMEPGEPKAIDNALTGIPMEKKPAPSAKIEPDDGEEKAAFYYAESGKSENQAGEDAEELTAPLEANGKLAASGKSFDCFVDDLTEYLNSNEYLVEFMRDSSRQGMTLCEEIQRHHDVSGARDLERQKALLDEQLAETRQKLEAAAALQKTDWRAAFVRVNQESEKQAAELGATTRDQVSNDLLKALDRWYDSDDSLKALTDKHWNPAIQQAINDVVQKTKERLNQFAGGSVGGAEVSADQVRQLDRIQLSLTAIKNEVLPQALNAAKADSCSVQVRAEDIPVRKTFLDYILFRTQTSLRRRVFGAPDSLDQPIPVDEKRKRLQVDGKTVLKNAMLNQLKEKTPVAARRCASQGLDHYIELFSKRVSDEIQKRKSQLESVKADLESRLDANQRSQAALEQLVATANDIADQVDKLRDRFHCQEAPAVEDPEASTDEQVDMENTISDSASESENEEETEAKTDDSPENAPSRIVIEPAP